MPHLLLMAHIMLYLGCMWAMFDLERQRSGDDYPMVMYWLSGLILFIPLEILYWTIWTVHWFFSEGAFDSILDWLVSL